MTSPCQAQTARQWDFNRNGDREGWTVPAETRGVVIGGSLWLTLASKEMDSQKLAGSIHQIFSADYPNVNGEVPRNIDIVSPRDLDLSATSPESVQLKLKMRVLNLSPVTDIFLRWRTRDQIDKFPDSHRCALKADLKEWQEVTCFVSKGWKGAIDQVAIGLARFPHVPMRGDLWIDRIEITEEGPGETVPPRPDVASVEIVPKITIPGISQSGFADASKVLDECLMVDVPVYGFTYPVMSPGGGYHGNWWLIDSSLTATGAKWTNQSFAENVMRGFRDVQAANPDGRIDMSDYAAVRGQVGDLTHMPWFFEVASDVARCTNDLALRCEIYQIMRKFLDWWLSPVKRDPRTGLISGVHEETFGEDESFAKIVSEEALAPQSVAPVDLNVAVAVGARLTADLASALGRSDEARRYRQGMQDLSRAINDFFWDEKDGVYYNYDLRGSHLGRRMLVSTFDPLLLGIAPPAHRQRLLKRLLDPAQFNWGKRPLTSLAMASR